MTHYDHVPGAEISGMQLPTPFYALNSDHRNQPGGPTEVNLAPQFSNEQGNLVLGSVRELLAERQHGVGYVPLNNPGDTTPTFG